MQTKEQILVYRNKDGLCKLCERIEKNKREPKEVKMFIYLYRTKNGGLSSAQPGHLDKEYLLAFDL